MTTIQLDADKLTLLFDKLFSSHNGFKYDVPDIYHWAFFNGLGIESDPTWQMSDDYRACNGCTLTPKGEMFARQMGYVCTCLSCNNLAAKGKMCSNCDGSRLQYKMYDGMCAFHHAIVIEKARKEYLLLRNYRLLPGTMEHERVFAKGRTRIRIFGVSWAIDGKHYLNHNMEPFYKSLPKGD